MLYSFFEDIQSLISRGGGVLYFIFIVTLLMWILIIERLWYFYFNFKQEALPVLKKWQVGQRKQEGQGGQKTQGGQERQREQEKPKGQTPSTKTLSKYSLRIWQADLSLLSQLLNKNISVIKTLVAVCPLLGLLGTVTGMVLVFETMAQIGTGNARLMASGISKATIPTMAGLLSALTGIYISNSLENRAKKEKQKIIDSFSPLSRTG